MYPANATTNSAAGVTDFAKIRRVLARMEKIGMTFLIHGEEADPEIDVFDREAVFIERRLKPMTKDFPGLYIVLEHLSSKEGVEFVASAAPQVGGTITPYHLMLTRTDWLGYGLRPYMYCMPVIKRREDRDALRKAATSGRSCYFLGTDSAPHPVTRKLNTVGAAGLFNSPGRHRILCPGLRRGECSRQARSICVIERPQALPASREQRDHHLGTQHLDRARRDQDRRARRARAHPSRRRSHSVESRLLTDRME